MLIKHLSITVNRDIIILVQLTIVFQNSARSLVNLKMYKITQETLARRSSFDF